MNDEFYIGWQDKAPTVTSTRLRRVVTLLLVIAFIACGLLAVSQSTIGVSVFEWGKVKTFSGILKFEPYPHLLVPRPGASEASNRFQLLLGEAFQIWPKPRNRRSIQQPTSHLAWDAHLSWEPNHD
jgi:hypothetical protein